MENDNCIAVVGTFDSKAEEHVFLKQQIEQQGMRALTVNVGTGAPSPVAVDLDLFAHITKNGRTASGSRDQLIDAMLREAKARIKQLYAGGKINAILSAGGGTGTHICTTIMRELPLGVPKVMVSSVASRNMAEIVGTRDITMMHSVADLLGVNSISGSILAKAAAAACAMARSRWQPAEEKKRIALPFFGFITAGAEATRRALEALGYEVIAFHANGTGGMAMEELAAEGYFDGILDLATHELADELMKGYCRGIGPRRYAPVPGRKIPRLVIPGGLDCAVLEFTRRDIPGQFKNRKIFFYDFRSAIRLNAEETSILADRLAQRLNRDPARVKVLIPVRGWSEADRQGGPLYDPQISNVFTARLKEALDPGIEVVEVDKHINDADFGKIAAETMARMVAKP